MEDETTTIERDLIAIATRDGVFKEVVRLLADNEIRTLEPVAKASGVTEVVDKFQYIVSTAQATQPECVERSAKTDQEGMEVGGWMFSMLILAFAYGRDFEREKILGPSSDDAG